MFFSKYRDKRCLISQAILKSLPLFKYILSIYYLNGTNKKETTKTKNKNTITVTLIYRG
jgi:hypothetical protein